MSMALSDLVSVVNPEPETPVTRKEDKKIDWESRIDNAERFALVVGKIKIPINYHLLRHYCPKFPGFSEKVPEEPELQLDAKMIDAVSLQGLVTFMKSPPTPLITHLFPHDHRMYSATAYIQCDFYMNLWDTHIDKALDQPSALSTYLSAVLEYAIRRQRDSQAYLKVMLKLHTAMVGYPDQILNVCNFIKGNVLPADSKYEQIRRDVMLVSVYKWTEKNPPTIDHVRGILHCPVGMCWDIDRKSHVVCHWKLSV